MGREAKARQEDMFLMSGRMNEMILMIAYAFGGDTVQKRHASETFKDMATDPLLARRMLTCFEVIAEERFTENELLREARELARAATRPRPFMPEATARPLREVSRS